MKLDDIAHLNPSLKIQKGKPISFIDMAALPIDAKFIQDIGKRDASTSGAKFQNGDTLFARITPCLENGKGGFVSGLAQGEVAQGSTEFIVLRARRSSDEQFVYYLSRYAPFREFAERSMEGTSGRQRVSAQALSGYDIPELDEIYRKSIGEILSALDDKIEVNRRMNETLEALAQAVFKDWFVTFGPTRRKMEGEADPVAILGGLIPDPTKAAPLAAMFPDSFGADGLPEGWEAREIGDQAQAMGGSTPSTKEPAFWEPPENWWATPKDLSSQNDLALFETERKISGSGLARITSGLLPVGTVLLSSRAPIGYLAISQVPVAINQGFIALPPNEVFGTAYLYLWCKANMEQIVANANGSTFQEISKKNFRPIKSAVPINEAVMAAFAEIVDPLIARIVASANENRTLAETRDYLLPKLMSGVVRVRDAAAMVD